MGLTIRVLLLAQEVFQRDFLELYPSQRSLVSLSLAIFTTRTHFVVRRGQHEEFAAHADACQAIGVAAAAEGHERERSRGGQLKATDLSLSSLRFGICLEHLTRALFDYPCVRTAQVLEML